MKKFLLYLVFSVFAVSITALAQQEPPDPIRQAEGILLSAPLHYDWVKLPLGNPGAVDSMRNQAGIDIVHLNVDREGQVDTLATNREYPHNYGFYVMPHRMLGLNLNHIQHYTHAKYTVWEAEGNANHIVNLVRHPSKTETDTHGDTTFVRRIDTVYNSIDTLIFGPRPWYTQDVKYHGSDDGTCDTVRYTAAFRLMLEENNQGYPPIEGNPEDTICVIQVTQSDTICTYVIRERIITRGEFDELNRFYEFRLDTVNNYDYRLTSDSCQAKKGPIPTDCGTIRLRSNVEFKVIWMGKSNPQGYPAYLLSVDKVTLAEERGQQMFGEGFGEVKALIESQADALSQYHNKMVGYIGPDEPRSIDLHAPMKRVTEILDENTQWMRPLWLFYAGGELYNKIVKNRVGRTNIALATFMFDLPCRPDISCDNCPTGSGDYRDKNVRWHSNNFKYAYELDPYYGINLQTGGSKPQYGDCSHQRNIERHELLYSANLALMHGAKFLSFSVQGYFAQAAVHDSLNPLGLSYHAIVDFTGTSLKNTIYTNKFSMVKDTLSPSLKGLFGKTIKKLIPGVDSLNINPSIAYDNVNINYLRKIELVRDQGTEALESYVDLRFFTNPAEYGDNYFMIINRWYSEPVFNRFRLKLKDLLGYNNWNLKNFMDGTNTTLLPDQNGNVTSPTDTILIGDAILYSIKPVVTDGGTLLEDEYAGEGMILNDDMIITNGAKLSVVGNYFANGNIIIDNGIIDVYTDQYSGTPKIYFQDGKKLIVKGSAIISGDEEDKLVLDFVSPDSANGIIIEQGGSLTISNSIVKNAETGILGSLNVTYLNAENVDFIDCESSSIVINGQSMEERGIGTPPPTN